MLHGWGSPGKVRAFEKLMAGLPPVVSTYLAIDTGSKAGGKYLPKGKANSAKSESGSTASASKRLRLCCAAVVRIARRGLDGFSRSEVGWR